MRVLIIDDNPDIRDILCKMLANEGYDTLVADNGKC